MKCINRYEEFKDYDFDKIILAIRRGNIKCGRYSHLVKVNENKILKGKEFFKDDGTRHDRSDEDKSN